jgi:hypothetical protein
MVKKKGGGGAVGLTGEGMDKDWLVTASGRQWWLAVHRGEGAMSVRPFSSLLLFGNYCPTMD